MQPHGSALAPMSAAGTGCQDPTGEQTLRCIRQRNVIDCHGIVRTKIGSHFAPKIGHRTQNWQGIDRMQVAELLFLGGWS